MDKKPVLVIMAAGLGSRYGGLKQIDPIDDEGEIIIDFSIYDAWRAGFEKVVFIIKRELEEDFRQRIGDRVSRFIKTEYVYQDINDIPEGYSVPEGRVKPWGTGHAVRSCRSVVDGPFAVINADDFYGAHAFREIYQQLSSTQDDDKYRFCMVGFVLGNTLTENGHVARGVCDIDGQGLLCGITERTKIVKKDGAAAYTEDDGETWTHLPLDTTVSMNIWGFSAGMINELDSRFGAFLERAIKENPMKGEYFLPSVVGELLAEDKATVKVLKSPDKWYGVTYKEDKPLVMQAIRRMKEEGLYPPRLWEE